MQHRDIVFDKRTRQRFRVGRDFFGRNPKRGPDQVADPDFFERHIEGHRKTLIDKIVLAYPEQGIFAAKKMADAALTDFDALGLTG